MEHNIKVGTRLVLPGFQNYKVVEIKGNLFGVSLVAGKQSSMINYYTLEELLSKFEIGFPINQE